MAAITNTGARTAATSAITGLLHGAIACIEVRRGAAKSARMTCASLTLRTLGSSMLGQFLEYSVAGQPLAASFEFFESLGFASIPVSDTLPDPYVVCFDGHIAIGVHERAQSGPRLTFVRPGLRHYVRPL